jgi:Phage integrase family
VFTREDGQVLHPERVSKRFTRLVRDAGVSPITLHGLRHRYATAALAAGQPLKVVSERLGHASTSITANLYQHVLPSMDERTANAVANLILGNREEDNESAVNPLSTGPQVHEPQEGGDARDRSSVGVSEGGLEPPRPMRALGPQPSASAYSATPTCSKGAGGRTGQAGRLMVARSRVFQGVRSKPWGPGVRTAAWCSVTRGAAVRSVRTAASVCW